MSTWAELAMTVAPTVSTSIVAPDGTRWSGDRLVASARAAASLFDEWGVPVGAVVPALLANEPNSVALVLAGAATGRPLAPLGVRLTARELTQTLAQTSAGVLVTSPDFSELAHAATSGTPTRVAVVQGLTEEFGAWNAADHPDDVAAVVHTSGTTGLPKPVPYRNRPLLERVRVNSSLMGLGPGTAYATSSPFHHIAGLGNVFVALGSGATLVSMPRFSVAEWQGLAERDVTHAFAAPAMIEMLLTENALGLPGLRLLQYGASPIRPETLGAAMERLPGVDFINFFGQTEGSPITVLTPEDHRRAAAGNPRLLLSVGRPPEGVEIQIHGPDARGIGEVWVRAEHLFRVEDDGWLHTGDLGWIGDDGYLLLTGRKGDLIIRGGENVYPSEVEEILRRHPDVADAAVVGRPDDRLGEIVKAYIVPYRAAQPPDPDELRAFTRRELSGFKVPAQWAFVKSLPRDASGKLRRRLIE